MITRDIREAELKAWRKRQTDLRLENHGSVCILYPETDRGRDWIAENLPEDVMTWGPDGIVIEPRYVGDILQGAEHDGLTVRA